MAIFRHPIAHTPIIPNLRKEEWQCHTELKNFPHLEINNCKITIRPHLRLIIVILQYPKLQMADTQKKQPTNQHLRMRTSMQQLRVITTQNCNKTDEQIHNNYVIFKRDGLRIQDIRLLLRESRLISRIKYIK